MQAEHGSTCVALAALPVSIDTSSHNELKHARGFLERDLRPESLWAKSTSLTCIPSDIVGKGASSSSNDVAPDIDNLGNSAYDPIEVLRSSDMENNVEFFLGPPGPLQRVVPASRPFSKVASLANISEYVPDWPVALPKANSASSGSGLARQGAQHF